jgi:hypothetical protein
MTRRSLILQAFVTRLSAITVDNGFETDAGATIYLGEAPALGPDDPAVAIALVVDDDHPTYQGEQVFNQLPIDICALAKVDIDQSWLAVEALIGDIKRAMELPDRTLGKLVPRQIIRGVTRTLPRETGSTTIGALVRYTAPFVEVWGNP